MVPFDLSFDERKALRDRAATRPSLISLGWHCNGREIRSTDRWTFVLPDRTGVVIGGANNKSPDELRVINADGSERFRLRGPLVVPGEPLLHGKVHLELPREGWPAGRIAFGPIACFESRRAFPVMLDLDWETGTVLGAEQLPRFF